jgi:hypothetical protein
MWKCRRPLPQVLPIYISLVTEVFHYGSLASKRALTEKLGNLKHRDENCGDYCVSLFKTVCFLFISLKYPGKERDRERETGRDRDRDREMSL